MQPVDVPLPPPPVTGEAARRAVAEVLARPEYADLEPGLLDRLWAALSRAVGALLDALTGTAAGSVIGYLVLLGLLAVVGVLAARMARSVRREATAEPTTGADVGRGAASWAAEAEDHEAAQRWRDAVRCRYRELVARLAAAGVVDEVAGRTAGEYLAEVGAALPAAREPFAVATGIFERAWYGREEVGAGDRDALRAAADAATAAAGAGAATTSSGARP